MPGFSQQKKDVALAFLAAFRGDFDKAARQSRVPVDDLREWAAQDGITPETLSATEISRPYPPAALLDPEPDLFVPAPDVVTWIEETFLAEDGAFHNPDHAHLCFANLGVLWTNVPNNKPGIVIAGTAELVRGSGLGWVGAREAFFIRSLFGFLPDFIITLNAPFLADCDHFRFGAVVDHELYHCAHAKDKWGIPKWDKRTGRPVWSIRRHDAEEFVGVVARWGVRAAAANVPELVAAAGRRPTITEIEIAIGCGTCAH